MEEHNTNVVNDLTQIKPGFNTIIVTADNPDAAAYNVTEILNDLERAEALLRVFGVQVIPLATQEKFTNFNKVVFRAYLFVELQ